MGTAVTLLIFKNIFDDFRYIRYANDRAFERTKNHEKLTSTAKAIPVKPRDVPLIMKHTLLQEVDGAGSHIKTEPSVPHLLTTTY